MLIQSCAEISMSPLLTMEPEPSVVVVDVVDVIVAVEIVAVDVVVVNNDQPLVTEHILSGGSIAMSRAAKLAVDQVRLVLL